MARPHSPLRMVRGGLSGDVLPLLRSMVTPPRFSVAMNWMTMLSVTMRTATLSTTGTSPRSVFAGAVLALPASVAITAETNPAPPLQSWLTPDRKGALASVQGPNSIVILGSGVEGIATSSRT